jgi:catechol 2,3-dioxygenase-like lactoylglutathione lyase family enzyme
MIDHVSIGVADLAKARDFYDRVLRALDQTRSRDIDIPGQGMVAHGYGPDAHGEEAIFWIGVPDHLDVNANRSGGVHLAFKARTRAAVDAFYAAAIAAGAADNGKPGLRPHYHTGYYGAFVFDPDGNKLEACCHHSES